MTEISKIHIKQANFFYNYTFGLNVNGIDLIKTATKLFGEGLVRLVTFSDLNVLYLDKNNNLKTNKIEHNSRDYDKSWKVDIIDDLQDLVIPEFVASLEQSFHDKNIQGPYNRSVAPNFRASLAPIVFEDKDLTFTFVPWIKIYNDGIVALSFQLDFESDAIEENDFIDNFVNLSHKYFKNIYMDAKIQRIDGYKHLENYSKVPLTFGGQTISNRATRKLKKEICAQSKSRLDKSLSANGKEFDCFGAQWVLHPIAGTENKVNGESTLEMCQSIISVAIIAQIRANSKNSSQNVEAVIWEGRPSISLMRFSGQESNKKIFLTKHSASLSRIMLRASTLKRPPELPLDLRPFDDYCFHGNRSLLLWTWMKATDAPDDAWSDVNVKSKIYDNQCRTEHFEYHNMRIARACSIVSSPSNDLILVDAYEILSQSEKLLMRSSHSGEITDAVQYLLNAVGTKDLINSAKEQAKWYLDEKRFIYERQRSNIDRSLTVVFGFVGAAGVADLILKPLLEDLFPSTQNWITGLAAFVISSLIVLLLSLIILACNRSKN